MNFFIRGSCYSVEYNREGGDMHEYNLASGMSWVVQGKNRHDIYEMQYR